MPADRVREWEAVCEPVEEWAATKNPDNLWVLVKYLDNWKAARMDSITALYHI